jgi:hypothetical protein
LHQDNLRVREPALSPSVLLLGTDTETGSGSGDRHIAPATWSPASRS